MPLDNHSTSVPSLRLHTGTSIPTLGFGCAEFFGPAGPEEDAYEQKLRAAYSAGYRIRACSTALSSTAPKRASRASICDGLTLMYRVGVGNFAAPLRSQLYLITKYMEYTPGDSVEVVLQEMRRCVRRMDPSPLNPHVDLFLIHEPTMGEEGRRVLWAALTELQKLGETIDIGVSNFGLKHLLTLPAPKPVVNQIELHPWCQHREMAEYCKQQGIILQAYAPNVRNRKGDNPVLQNIARELNKSPTQVLLRWSVQNGHIPVPASNSPSRMAENISVFDFELSATQMNQLDELGADRDHPVCKTYDDFCD